MAIRTKLRIGCRDLPATTKWLLNEMARCRVPYPHYSIVTTGHHFGAIRAKAHASDPVAMSKWNSDRPSRLDLPNLSHVPSAGHYALTIGTELDRVMFVENICVPERLRQDLSRPSIPNACCLIV